MRENDTDITILEPHLKALDPAVDSVKVVRERAAIVLGSLLFGIFVIAVIFELSLCLIVLLTTKDAITGVKLVGDILTAGEHFDAAVLLPLLAFALGHYFGSHNAD
jgi:hypothetical protein